MDLLVPVKTLSSAKSRLRGAADGGVGEPAPHARLTLALALDTVAAARATRRVGRVIVVSSDPEVAAVFAADGVAVLHEGTAVGLNAALEHGARTLRAAGATGSLGALQADLPALRAEELDAALAGAQALFEMGRCERVFCTDAQGEGTTLLVCGPDAALRPRFGVRSAAAHQRGGAVPLDGRWAGLRRDVDTPEDLRDAAELGLGRATSAVLGRVARARR